MYLERVQRAALRNILGIYFKNYEDPLIKADLDSLKIEESKKKGLKNQKTKDLYPSREKAHCMKTREEEQFSVNFAHTGRLTKSAIPHMQ